MRNLPRPDQMEYFRVLHLKSENPTLKDKEFKKWLDHVKRTRLQLTKKNNEI